MVPCAFSTKDIVPKCKHIEQNINNLLQNKLQTFSVDFYWNLRKYFKSFHVTLLGFDVLCIIEDFFPTYKK